MKDTINTREVNGDADAMPQITGTPPPDAKTYPAELKSLLERGNAGDVSVLPALKKAFDQNPELAALLGDLVGHAERSVLALAAGRSLTAKEAIARQVADLRSRLVATARSELEKLLIDRICLSWIEVYHGDVDLAQRLLQQPDWVPGTAAAQKRLDRAHARFLSAVKALAVVQKLIRPPLSPLDLLARPPEEMGGGGASGPRQRSTASPRRGVPVLD